MRWRPPPEVEELSSSLRDLVDIHLSAAQSLCDAQTWAGPRAAGVCEGLIQVGRFLEEARHLVEHRLWNTPVLSDGAGISWSGDGRWGY